MAAPKRDNDIAARALVEAILTDDRTATEKFGITTRTLRRYRQALAEDPELSAVFQEHLKEFMKRSWADDLNDALQQIMLELVRHVKGQLLMTPDSIEAITSAFKAVSEIALAKEVLLSAADSSENAAAILSSRPVKGDFLCGTGRLSLPRTRRMTPLMSRWYALPSRV